jgi:hypothetical protein
MSYLFIMWELKRVTTIDLSFIANGEKQSDDELPHYQSRLETVPCNTYHFGEKDL